MQQTRIHLNLSRRDAVTLMQVLGVVSDQNSDGCDGIAAYEYTLIAKLHKRLQHQLVINGKYPMEEPT